MREISLDKNNGLHGKTVIHPSHVSIVNAMLTVNRDEWDDAVAIKASAHHGGVVASLHGRMNEMGPHALWAEQICARAAAYGVLVDDAALVDLLAAGQHTYASTYGARQDVLDPRPHTNGRDRVWATPAPAIVAGSTYDDRRV